MNATWQIKKLGEVCDILDNQRKPVTQRDRISGKYPYYGATGIQDYVSDYIFDEKLILIGEDGAKWGAGENTAFIAEGKYWVNNHAHVIRPHRDEVLDNWIIYFLNVNDLSKYITGLTVQKLNQGKLRDIEIQLPSLMEQKRIIKILDEVFEKIAKTKENTEKNLQNSHELFESYLQSVFVNPSDKWEEKTLSEVSNYFGRGKSKHRPRNDKKLYGGKHPFIQTGDIRNSNHFIDKYSQTYNEAGLSQSKLWPKGTICITIAANIAETGILNFDACFPDSVIGIVVNPKITEINYVEYLLQSFKTRLKAKGKGSAQNNINLATFENQLFPFPPLSVQEIIVKKLDELSEQRKRLEEIYKQKLADLEELKKSILSKAFAGEL